MLEKNLLYFSQMIKKKFNKNIAGFKAGGAAGGIAAGLKGFFKNAAIRSGAEIHIELTGLDKKIHNYDLIVTGEGRMDSQSIYGKAVRVITDLGREKKIRVIAICGSLGAGYEKMYKYGISHIEDIMEYPISLDEAIKNSKILLQRASFRIAKNLLGNKV